MKKDVRFTVRLNTDLFIIIKKIAEDCKLTVSGVIILLIENGITNEKISSKFHNMFKQYSLRKLRTKLCNEIYIKKNMYSRVMDMAMSDFFISGSVNMKAINLVVDGYLAEFDSYDETLKKKIGIDFRIAVKQLRDENYLINQCHDYKRFKLIAFKK